ncbi:MAG: superoxide dismutase [Dongiaceae bacterium]
MAFALPPLPYDHDALEPHISARTMKLHHDKHHAAYVEKLNKLVAGTALEKCSLEQVIMTTRGDARATQTKIFNNAAQVWNHTFFWNCLAPKTAAPKASLRQRIEKSFGGLDKFNKSFKTAAVEQFGSGWAWLVESGGELKVKSTSNAVPPFVDGDKVLLTCDVWEHAYYLDYQNKRDEFVTIFLEKLVNWDFVASRLAETQESAA